VPSGDHGAPIGAVTLAEKFAVARSIQIDRAETEPHFAFAHCVSHAIMGERTRRRTAGTPSDLRWHAHAKPRAGQPAAVLGSQV